MRWICVGGGVIALAASTYMNVHANGGLSGEAAPGLIAMALILAIGSAAASCAWAGRHTIIALAICLGMFAGEVGAMLSTAQRVAAARSAMRAPVLETEDKHSAAVKRLAKAEMAVAAVDADITTKAALPGCRANCRQLLQSGKEDAIQERDAARNALSDVPASKVSPTPLADATGFEQWVLDLIEALSISLAINIPASAFIALGVKLGARREPESDARSIVGAIVEPPVAQVLLPRPIQTETRNPSREAERFGLASLRPTSNGRLTHQDLQTAYLSWCRSAAIEPLPPNEIAPALGKMFRTAGIKVLDGEAVGVALSPLARRVNS